MVGDVVTAPDGWPAGVGQSCRTLPTTAGVAGLWPDLVSLDLASALGPLATFAL